MDDMGLIRCYRFLLTSTLDILCVDTCLVILKKYCMSSWCYLHFCKLLFYKCLKMICISVLTVVFVSYCIDPSCRGVPEVTIGRQWQHITWHGRWKGNKVSNTPWWQCFLDSFFKKCRPLFQNKWCSSLFSKKIVDCWISFQGRQILTSVTINIFLQNHLLHL